MRAIILQWYLVTVGSGTRARKARHGQGQSWDGLVMERASLSPGRRAPARRRTLTTSTLLRGTQGADALRSFYIHPAVPPARLLAMNVREAEGRAGTVRSNQRSSNALYCRVNQRMNNEIRRDSCSSSLINFVLNLSKLFLMNCRMSSS